MTDYGSVIRRAEWIEVMTNPSYLINASKKQVVCSNALWVLSGVFDQFTCVGSTTLASVTGFSRYIL